MAKSEAQQPPKGGDTNTEIFHPEALLKQQLDTWSPFFPLILTMIGWLVVSSQHNKRERRKEVRELIRLVEQKVDSIVEKSSEYYTIDGKDQKCRVLEHQVRSAFTAISQLLTRLKSAGLSHKTDGEYIFFKQAVTGGQFESKARKRIDSSGAVLNECAVTGFTFVSKLDQAYFDQFPVRMKSF